MENASDDFPSERSSKISFQTSPEVRHQFRRKLRQLHSGNRWCLNKGTQGVRARYDAELPPIISIVRCPDIGPWGNFFRTNSWVNFAGDFVVDFLGPFSLEKQEEKSIQKSTPKFKSELGSFATKSTLQGSRLDYHLSRNYYGNNSFSVSEM